jgi:DNA-binding MarR family transcriptional regulator
MMMMVRQNELSSEEIGRLERLLAAIDLFAAEIDKDMPMQMLRALLMVCIEEGKGPNELARKAGLESGVMSRHLSDLGERNRYKQSGYEMVEQKADVMDRRYRQTFLTPKGVGFRNRLLRLLGR